MSTPTRRTASDTLALVIQYLYETDSDFEKALDKVLFQEPSKTLQSKDKKKRKKSKFNLERLVKKQARMKGKKRPKK